MFFKAGDGRLLQEIPRVADLTYNMTLQGQAGQLVFINEQLQE